jgi:hypothetical protein
MTLVSSPIPRLTSSFVNAIFTNPVTSLGVMIQSEWIGIFREGFNNLLRVARTELDADKKNALHRSCLRRPAPGLADTRLS